MPNQFDMHCPKCGSDDYIDVMASSWRRLMENGTDGDISFQGSSWEPTSAARCGDCGFKATVADFGPAIAAKIDAD